MSRNSKNARLHKEAKLMGEQRQKGNKGPARTQSKHGKKNAWFQKYDTYSQYIAAGKKKPRKEVEVEAVV
jgi:hypothetical protein